MSLALISLVLAIVLVALCWYSAKNHGLGKDDGSTSLLVGWRYTPTIIAVLFTQSCVIIAEDVKRTEAFARMASPEPIEAKFTLLYVPQVWWKSVFEGFSRKRSGGHRGWVLAFSSLMAGLSLLFISTFSSSVFIAKDVVFRGSVELQRFTSDQNGTLPLMPRRDTYLHTITGFSYNASTSIWVTDSVVILPFQPATNDTEHQSLRDGAWEAETKVIQMESNCVPMTMTEKTAVTVSYSYAAQLAFNETCTKKSKGFKLQSKDGCEIQMQTTIACASVSHNNGSVTFVSNDGYALDTMTENGGVFWTNMSSSYISWQDLVQEHGQNPYISSSGERILKQWGHAFIYSLSDQCRGRDLLLVTPAWSTNIWSEDATELEALQSSYWVNFTARAELCTPTYFEATLPVTVSVSGDVSKLSFDPLELARHRTPVSPSLLNLARLDDLSFRGSWSKYMLAPGDNRDVEGFEGVSMLLAKPFAYNLTDMQTNATLAFEAGRLRSRFFNELLLSSAIETDVPVLESIAGHVIMTEKRIIVVAEVAIALVVLFLFVASYLLVMVWVASTGRRPLYLRTDPATTIGTTLLVPTNSSLATKLRALRGCDRDSLQNAMGSEVYTLHASTITRKAHAAEVKTDVTSARPEKKVRRWFKTSTLKKTVPSDWRPHMLHKRWLTALLTVLVAIAISLLVLRQLAIEGRLYRTAFVYQVDVGLFNNSFSPHSVITALIAVATSLCWGGIDKPMRTLQPYLSMSRGSSEASRGVLLSYQSSYWAWAAANAALSKHWVLCLVTIGTTLSQICEVLRPFF
jgi:hypothetical protein